jgi:hypothetical protein
MEGECTERGMGRAGRTVACAAAREIKIRIKIRRRLGGWCGWDEGAVGGGGAFPAVAVLAGLNEDLFAGPGGGEAGQVEGGDVADAVCGGGEEAKIDGSAHTGPAGAAGGAGKDQEVAFGAGGDEQFEAEASGVPAEAQFLDGVGAKGGGSGRGPEQWGASGAAQDAVEFEVGLLAGKGAVAGAPAAVDAAGVEVPGVALGLGEAGEPVFGQGAEEASHVELGRGAGVAGDDVGAAIDGPAANGGVVKDDGAALAQVDAQFAAGEAGLAGVIGDHGSLLRGGSNLSLNCLTWSKRWNEELKLSNAKCGLVIGDW